jgi:hypothetical protein
MPMRRESGRAFGSGRKTTRRRKPVAPVPVQSSSLGGAAARAHGYSAPKPSVVRNVRRRETSRPSEASRTPLRTQYRRDVAEESQKGSAASRGAVFRKQYEETARKVRIQRTEQRLRRATGDQVKYDERTGNFVRKHRRAILPDVTGVVDPRTGEWSRNFGAQKKQSDVKFATAGSTAVALKVLDQTQRPTRAIAGATRAALRGESPTRAAVRGLVQNKGPHFGEVFHEDLGLGKGASAALGFVADVGTDPSSYVTFGTKGVAEKVAERTARSVARRAVRAGMSEEGARTVAARAAKRAAAGARRGKGVTVRFGGKELPGVTRASERVGAGVARVVPGRVKNAGRAMVREANPRVAREGVDQATHTTVRQAERRSRSARANLASEAMDQARVLAERIPEKDQPLVVDAVERNRIGKLPDHLREPARELRDQFRYAQRLRSRAGVAEGSIGRTRATRVTAPKGVTKKGRLTAGVSKPRFSRDTVSGYFPHMREEDIAPTGVKQRVRSTGSLQPPSSRARGDLRPVSVRNVERAEAGKGAISTNIPLVRANYGAQTAGAVAKGRLVQGLKQAGRPAKRAARFDPESEAVFHFSSPGSQAAVRELNPKVEADARELRNLLEHGHPGARPGSVKRSGRYLILNKRAANEALRRIEQSRTEAGAFFDKAQGVWKFVATGTPGFQIRNAIGDTQMAFLAQGRHLPKNMVQGARATRRVSQLERARQLGEHLPRSTKTIKVGGQRMNMDDFVREAMDEGAARGGQRGHEIGSFTKGEGRVARVKRVRSNVAQRAGQPVGRALRNREDLTRLATYKWARDQGLSKSDAADAMLAVHFDYGDLTNTERVVLRRAAPFYTFSARALPFHVKAVLKHPGRVAGIEKARQELGFAFGMKDEDLPEYKQRAIPFAAPGGRALDAALPLNLLNEVPNPGNLRAYPAELFQFVGGQLTPFIKNPIELGVNRSFYFRKDIQSDDYPRVAAPSWVGRLPKPVRDQLGVVKIKDRRTGKPVLGWYGRTDYIAKSVPGFPVLLQQLTTEGSLRSGRQGVDKFISAVGVKSDPVDPVSNELYNLLKKSHDLQVQINAQRQTPTGGGGKRSQSAKTRGLYAEQGKVDERIYRLSVQRGDKDPYKATTLSNRAKVRATADPGAKADPETESLLREARQSAPAPSGRELESLLREARGG